MGNEWLSSEMMAMMQQPSVALLLALSSGKGTHFPAPHPKLLSDVLLLLPVSKGPAAQPHCLPTLLLPVEQLQRAVVGSP